MQFKQHGVHNDAAAGFLALARAHLRGVARVEAGGLRLRRSFPSLAGRDLGSAVRLDFTRHARLCLSLVHVKEVLVGPWSKSKRASLPLVESQRLKGE